MKVWDARDIIKWYDIMIKYLFKMIKYSRIRMIEY